MRWRTREIRTPMDGGTSRPRAFEPLGFQDSTLIRPSSYSLDPTLFLPSCSISRPSSRFSGGGPTWLRAHFLKYVVRWIGVGRALSPKALSCRAFPFPCLPCSQPLERSRSCNERPFILQLTERITSLKVHCLYVTMFTVLFR